MYVTELEASGPKFLPLSLRRVKTLRSDMPLDTPDKSRRAVASPNDTEAELLRQFDKVLRITCSLYELDTGYTLLVGDFLCTLQYSKDYSRSSM